MRPVLLLALPFAFVAASSMAQDAPGVSGEQPRARDSRQIEPESDSHDVEKPRPQATDPKDRPSAAPGTPPQTGPDASRRDRPHAPGEPKRH